MATRRYRKRSKKSLKKRTSKRRKNIRSSRRMRGGEIECKPHTNMGNMHFNCKYDLSQYSDYKDTNGNIYTFLKSQEIMANGSDSNSNPITNVRYEYIFKNKQKYDEKKKEMENSKINNTDIIQTLTNTSLNNFHRLYPYLCDIKKPSTREEDNTFITQLTQIK